VLNPDSPLPLYRQLADKLREGIREGEYPAGTRIPSEHALAERFGIGRPTVRQATDLLVRQRLLERRRGAGTFVCRPTDEVDLFSLAGTSAAFLEKGIEVTTDYIRPLELTSIGDQVGTPFDGDSAYALSRVYRVASGPVLLEEIYLDPNLFRGIERYDLRGDSLARIVGEHFYLRPESAHQSFTVAFLDREDARALEVDAETPVLQVRRGLCFRGVGDAIVGILYCRTDRFAFSQTLGPADVLPDRFGDSDPSEGVNGRGPE